MLYSIATISPLNYLCLFAGDTGLRGSVGEPGIKGDQDKILCDYIATS